MPEARRVLRHVNSYGSSIQLLDARNGIKVQDLRLGNNEFSQVFDAELLATGRVAAATYTGSADANQVVVWDPHGILAARALDAYDGAGFAIEPSGQLIAVSAGGGTVALERVDRGEFVRPGPVATLVPSADGRRWFVVSPEGNVTLWDATRRTQLAAFGRKKLGNTQYGNSRLAVTADGATLAALVNSRLKIVSTRSQRPLGRVPITEPIDGMALRRDGTAVVIATHTANGRSIGLWRPATGKQLHTYRTTGGSLTAMAFSPDGRYLAAGGEEDVVVLDAVEQRQVATLSAAASAIVFSPGGKTLAVATDSTDIQLWDPHLQRRRATLPGSGPVESLAFSPDGRTLASIAPSRDMSDTQRLDLWDVQQGSEIASVVTKSTDPNLSGSLFFSTDGASILATGAFVHSRPVRVAAWAEHLCSILPRTFTTEQAERYLGGWSVRDLKLCG